MEIFPVGCDKNSLTIIITSLTIIITSQNAMNFSPTLLAVLGVSLSFFSLRLALADKLIEACKETQGNQPSQELHLMFQGFRTGKTFWGLANFSIHPPLPRGPIHLSVMVISTRTTQMTAQGRFAVAVARPKNLPWEDRLRPARCAVRHHVTRRRNSPTRATRSRTRRVHPTTRSDCCFVATPQR